MYKKIILVIWWILTITFVVEAVRQILDQGSYFDFKIMVYLLICIGVCILLYIWES